MTASNNIDVDNAVVRRGGSRAYVTFLAGDGDYVKGIIGLAKGLRKVKAAYPLVVAVLPDVPLDHRKMLLAQACIVREIDPVDPPANGQDTFARPYYGVNYSKIQIWKLVEYAKLIYLDGDIQVFDNIDHLFDLPNGYLHGVMSCFCEEQWIHTPQYRVRYCQLRPKEPQWPYELLGPKPPIYINAGMFVYEPSLSTYDDLLLTLRSTPCTTFAEQDLLNMYFKDKIRPIPNTYNLLLQMLWRHSENVDLSNVKVVHYCPQGSKPWRYTGEEENMEREDIKMVVNKWWHIYNDPSLDHKVHDDVVQGGEAG